METNFTAKIKKILSAFKDLDKYPKLIIKYGTHVFLLLFAIGTGLVVYNRTILNFEPYFEFVAMSIVKISFTILAEAVIGGLLIDFIFKKK